LPPVQTEVMPRNGSRPGAFAPKTIRLRDKEHRRFVAHQPCLICSRSPCDAHHLKFT